MRLLDDIRRDRNEIAPLLIVGVFLLFAELILGGFEAFPDTDEYFETVEWYMDGSGEEFPLRIQRPLQILVVALIEPIMGAEGAFVLVNSVLFLASIPFFYLFCRSILPRRDDAVAAAVFFLCSFSVLYWGLALLTDMLVWFCISVSFYLLARISMTWESHDMYMLAAVVGIGILNKESAVSAGLVFLFLYVVHQRRQKRNLLRTATSVAPLVLVMGLPFLIVQLAIFYVFGPGYSFFDYHLTHTGGDVRGELWYLPVTFAIAFNVALLFYAFGIGRFLKDNEFLSTRAYVACLLLAAIPVVAFEQYSPRLSFLVFPFVLPPAAAGLNRLTGSGRLKLPYWSLLAGAAVLGIGAALFGDELRDLFGIWSR